MPGAAAREGCRARLSLPAAAVTWILISPFVATARLLAAITLARRTSQSDVESVEGEQLGRLATVTALACGAALLHRVVPSLALLAPQWPVGAPHALFFISGLAIGALMPCTLGAITFAASFQTTLPPLCAGVLCTAGLTPAGALGKWSGRSRDRIDRRWVTVSLLLCFLWFARSGATGYLHPRLAWMLFLGAIAALICSLRARRYCSPSALAAPLVLALAIVVGPAGAPPVAQSVPVDALYPGEHLRFSGLTASDERTTSLTRSVMTCCRADAVILRLPLDRKLPVAEHTWIQAEGTIARRGSAFELRVERAARIAPPSDPFLYR